MSTFYAGLAFWDTYAPDDPRTLFGVISLLATVRVRDPAKVSGIRFIVGLAYTG